MVCRRYVGQRIALATLHGKERILAKPLWHGLGLSLCHARSVNTDLFGSFSGERVRTADAPTTCRQKAEAALQSLDLDLGIASEGSFGPHPAIPWLPVNEEWLTFVDRRESLVISEHLLTHTTNLSSCTGDNLESVTPWLQRIGFPSHAVMVRAHAPEREARLAWLAKGIDNAHDLAIHIREGVIRSPLGLAWLETDMRAHCNPTRRTTIRRLAFRLVRRVASTCPDCGAPGWGRVATIPGLPCQACGQATALVQWEVNGCQICGTRQDRPRRDGLLKADPMHCLSCNP